MSAVLIQLSYSPWSERARWALDHHRIEYRPVEYLPMVGEPILRVTLAALTKSFDRLLVKPTVPILLHEGQVFADSVSIAEHAERIGAGSPLIPEASRMEVLAWVDAADRLLEAGRARLVDRMLHHEGALAESLPPPLRALGPIGIASAKMGTAFVKRKHVAGGQTMPQLEARMDAELERLERALDGGPYLLGEFTLADIAMAAALDMVDVRPSSPLGPASREVWNDPPLAKAHPRAIAFRDRMYAEHR